MSRPFRYVMLGLLACVLSVCAGFTLPVEILAYLGVGWAFFLARVVPGVTVDWGGAAIAGVCLVTLAVLSHSFLGWLRKQAGATPWKVRWTASLVASLVLMFAAGISAAGIAHQVGWLTMSGEPLIDSGSRVVQRVQSASNLRQIGLGVENYRTSEKSYPPGVTIDAEGRLLHGWMARILPFIAAQEVSTQIDFAVPWDDPRNAAAYRTRLLFFINPRIRDNPEGLGPAPSHYAGNVWALGGDLARGPAQFSDGLATTILAGEVGAGFKPWGYPANWRDPARGINRSPEGFGSPFAGGANFLFADGSVRFLRDKVDPKVLRALATPAGGESVPLDDY